MDFVIDTKNFLVDTNIFLEILLDQEKSNECQEIFKLNYKYFISDFSLYSIGIILIKHRKQNVLLDFIQDLFNNIDIIRIDLDDLNSFYDIVNNSEKFRLDFDDAYQYTIAKKNNLLIISYDNHFDKTDIKRIEPKEFFN